MDKFNRYFDEKDMPACRFGPGGDFFTDWPARVTKDSRQPIGSILAAIAKMLDTAITTELLQDSTIEKINLAINSTQLTADMEDKFDVNKSIYGEQGRTNEPDAQTAPGAQTCRKLSQEPMLFDNASGAGSIAGHKSNNGIRAHRRPKRKRIAFSASRQGSLFEPYTQSSKVA
jgi:hypothetical protein